MGGQSPRIEDDRVVVRNENSLSATLDGEAVLLEPEAGTYYEINEIGTQIWDRLESPTSVAELREFVRSNYDAEADVVDRDVESFLTNLVDANLIELRSPDDAP